MRLPVLVLAVGACGCAGSGVGVDPPYRFRQSLIDPEASAPVAATARPEARSVGVRRDASSCRRQLGRELGGRDGRLALVRACTGVALRRPPVAEAVSLRAEPELLDLALFRSGPAGREREPELGVVLARSGPRIEFVFVRGGRARLGVLSLAQPHRRRLPGSARVENSYLRVIERGDPSGTRYLAGELLAGFVSAASLP